MAMSAPLPFWSLGDEQRTLGLALAVLFGVAFGFVLERAGFGRASKLVGQFYGYDMSVLKVIFTAIVTAMAGALILSAVGLFDLASVELRYPTFLWPMVVGGLLLGAGFVVSGYCPGTCVVATASGKLDGLATVGGVVVGTLVYAEMERAMGSFTQAGALGSFTLWQWLGLPAAVVAVGVAAVAVAAFAAATRIERAVNRRAPPPAAPAK
jgi:hypothetical protein